MRRTVAILSASLLVAAFMLAGCVSAGTDVKTDPGAAGSVPGGGSGNAAPSGSKADEDMLDFLAVTGLDKMQEALSQGAEIISFHYEEDDDGKMESFKTENPDEIKRLWDAICKIKISAAKEPDPDSCPEASFTLSNGDSYTVLIDDDELEMVFDSGTVAYQLANDGEFEDIIDYLENHQGTTGGAGQRHHGPDHH